MGFSLHYCTECGERINPGESELEQLCWRCLDAVANDASDTVSLEAAGPSAGAERFCLPIPSGRRRVFSGFSRKP